MPTKQLFEKKFSYYPFNIFSKELLGSLVLSGGKLMTCIMISGKKSNEPRNCRNLLSASCGKIVEESLDLVIIYRTLLSQNDTDLALQNVSSYCIF